MGKGSRASLVLAIAVVCSPMAQARFLSPDPKLPIAGNIFGFNRYAYANNNPVTNLDPDGRDCTTANRVTTCSTVMYRVQFPAQPGFKDFTTSSPNYHFYSVPVDTPGHTVTEDQNYLVQRPTPGSSNGASPQGTRQVLFGTSLARARVAGSGTTYTDSHADGFSSASFSKVLSHTEGGQSLGRPKPKSHTRIRIPK